MLYVPHLVVPTRDRDTALVLTRRDYVSRRDFGRWERDRGVGAVEDTDRRPEDWNRPPVTAMSVTSRSILFSIDIARKSLLNNSYIRNCVRAAVELTELRKCQTGRYCFYYVGETGAPVELTLASRDEN